MNPMIAALQKSRQNVPPAPPAPLPGDNAPDAGADAGPGDVMVKKLGDLDAKLDQILKLLGADQTEDAAENDGTEAPPNDDGN